MSTQTDLPAPERKHHWLARFRRWHKWGGLGAGLFLLVVASSGIVLNYKRPIFAVLGLEGEAKEAKSAGTKSRLSAQRENPAGALTTAAGFTAGILSLDQALATARDTWGDVSLERIELRADRGLLVYRVRARGGAEVQINAITGAHFLKGAYEKVKVAADGTAGARTPDWGKIILDLHTGQIGGEAGKIIMSLAALLLIFLTMSGVYLWLKPVYLRRKKFRPGVPAMDGRVSS